MSHSGLLKPVVTRAAIIYNRPMAIKTIDERQLVARQIIETLKQNLPINVLWEETPEENRDMKRREYEELAFALVSSGQLKLDDNFDFQLACE